MERKFISQYVIGSFVYMDSYIIVSELHNKNMFLVLMGNRWEEIL